MEGEAPQRSANTFHGRHQPVGATAACCGDKVADIFAGRDGIQRLDAGYPHRAMTIRASLVGFTVRIMAAHYGCYSAIARQLGKRGLSGVD